MFQETLTFRKPLLRGLLTVSVFDDDTLSDDNMGACVIDLHARDPPFPEDFESASPERFDVVKGGGGEGGGVRRGVST